MIPSQVISKTYVYLRHFEGNIDYCFQENIRKNSCICGLLRLQPAECSIFKALDIIMKTYLYKFDPLKPHFYTVKLGFTGVYIIFLISAQNIDCGYSLEPPHRGGSNEYPQSMF